VSEAREEANPILKIFGYTGNEKWEGFTCKLCGSKDFGKGMEGICASCWSKKK
jgi:hypothetical protein